MKKNIIATEQAPSAIGPYSQAVVTGNLVFTSGQLPIHPGTGEIAADIADQTRQCLENIKAILEAAGTNLDHVIKTNIFVTDMNDFAVVNQVYGAYFTNNFPARATVGISSLAKGAKIEIDAMAILP